MYIYIYIYIYTRIHGRRLAPAPCSGATKPITITKSKLKESCVVIY